MNYYGFDFTEHLENMEKTIEQSNRKINRFKKALKEVEIHFKKESRKVMTAEEIKTFEVDKKIYFISCPFLPRKYETYSKPSWRCLGMNLGPYLSTRLIGTGEKSSLP